MLRLDEMKNSKLSLGFIGFLQAAGVAFYCGLIGLLLWRGNKLFGKTPNFLGAFLFLVLFSASALVCALFTLGYPAFLVWKKKQTIKALKLVSYTAGWLVFFVLFVLFYLFYARGYFGF